ncbi:FKBP-type peptidyl-prolyl cis-trans isomerase [Flavobacterium sp. H122]|uniref:FKBP-type peptidyl-prolyl cis-trans isomerase n=1 Tax=Flavobacterium sp. H122 TaxID=2529860 RepID=UPI0010AA7C0C|nr:hypothetical protein [Flavobacterium sp. H122]
MQILRSLLVLFLSVIVLSCNKDDEAKSTPKKPYAEQAPIDDLAINKFLDEYNMEVSTDLDNVSFTKITTENNLPSIRSEFNIQTKIVKVDDYDHKMYYIKFADGNGLQPTAVDSIFANYKGEYIYTKKEEVTPSTDPKTYIEYIASSKFEAVTQPAWMSQAGYIKGWTEFVSLLKTGDSSVDSNGSAVFENFGAGVVFMPSALGYYNSGTGNIPKYAPLIFNISLKKMNYIDHDRDGLDSVIEEFVYDTAQGMYVAKKNDTDANGVLDMYDTDDDADYYLTKTEIANSKKHFPSNGLDSDLDGKKDYLDTDDDNDGILSKNEKLKDCDNDGIPSYLDYDDGCD